MKTYLCLIAVCCFLGCTKEGPAGPSGKDGAQDKQIIFHFDFPYASQNLEGFPYLVLAKFDKRNFVGVDSIILVANPTVEDKGSPGTFCLMDVYNLTDDVPIANSLISSNRPQDSLNNSTKFYGANTYLQSGNFYSSLPNKEINLGIRIRTSTKGVTAHGASKCFIILYRR